MQSEEKQLTLHTRTVFFPMVMQIIPQNYKEAAS